VAVLLIIAVLGAALVFTLARSRFWPYGRCPRCRGRKGRGIGSTERAFSRCGWCGGSGERIRPLALIWPAHREAARDAARKRKRDRSRC
jgi:hypothetical protein